MAKAILLAAAGLISLALPPSGSALAGPAFCTGTTTVIASGTFVPGSALVGTGNCVEAADKIFGAFNVSGAITGGGSAGWLFTMATGPADVTLGFQGLVGSNSTGSLAYSVAVDPALSNGAEISALEKDFTFNSLGAGSTAMLTGGTAPGAASFTGGDISTGFQCTRTATSSTCPQTGFFSPTVTQLTVNETITTGANTNVTGLTDTVFQSIPEPASLGLFGVGLVTLRLVRRRRYA